MIGIVRLVPERKERQVRVYLSGPMKGYPNSNFPAFHSTAAALRARGLEVVNPAEIGVSTAENDPNFYNDCMRADLKAMMDCEAIALMRGWEASNGANLELHVAHRVGMRVLFVDELLAG